MLEIAIEFGVLPEDVEERMTDYWAERWRARRNALAEAPKGYQETGSTITNGNIRKRRIS